MKRLRSDEGSALVEFALVLPLFIVVLIGSITFIWVLGARSAVSGAARDGARYASIQHDWLDCAETGPCNTSYPTPEEVLAYVQDRAGVFGVDSVCMIVGNESATNTCSTEPATTEPYRNEVITVTATRELPNIFGSFASIFGADKVSYTTSAVARAE